MGNNPAQPIFYSFRRCPYAMRARMALHVAGIAYEHREVSLREKPVAMLAVSPKGTVPVLHFPDGRVLEESLDIMRWALEQADPAGWLDSEAATDSDAIIATIDGPFKHHLDRMKYANRYPGEDAMSHRHAAIAVLTGFEARLEASPYLTGGTPKLADVASFPFIRQFARADLPAWQVEALPNLHRWLDGWITSPLFAAIMTRHPLWTPPPAGTLA